MIIPRRRVGPGVVVAALGQGSPPLRLLVFWLFLALGAGLLRLWSFLNDLAGPRAALGGLFFLVRRDLVLILLLLVLVGVVAQVLP